MPYLLELFKLGIKSHQKASPESVSKEMAKDDRFEKEEKLSAEVIKSFFGRLNLLHNTKKLDAFEQNLKKNKSENRKIKDDEFDYNNEEEKEAEDNFEDMDDHVNAIEIRRSTRNRTQRMILNIEDYD